VGLWWGIFCCGGRGRGDEVCLDGPELPMVGRNVSFNSLPILEPNLDNITGSSLVF